MNINPKFGFIVPNAYTIAKDRKLFGYQNQDSALEPWFYMDADNVFDVCKKWPSVPNERAVELIVFARRFDNDDMACFEVSENVIKQIVVVHGWTPTGYDVIVELSGFWHWVKLVIDDVASVSSISDFE